nr:MAG: hypothetical protein BECKFM1743A_GA0114220_100042 [Candidatus Kentron sp. FM]VFJ43942.1 MAG: hypothetical protein BECKFM1743C_GA0114222_1000617 [Candidatus Kentron sp. FM]
MTQEKDRAEQPEGSSENVSESQQQTKRLEDKIFVLENTNDRLSKKVATFPKFSMLISIMTFLVLFSYIVINDTGMTKRIADQIELSKDDIESSMREDIKNEMLNEIAEIQNISDGDELFDKLYKSAQETNDELKNKMAGIELRQKMIVEGAKGSLESMYFIFTAVSALFSILGIYFAYRHIHAESKKEESQEKHDQEMRGLVGSFQNNIDTINSLIETLQQSYSYKEEVEREIKELRERHHEGEEKFRESILKLNTDAVRLYKEGFSRTTLNREERKRELKTFSNQMNNMAANRNIENQANPFCYYIRGLAHIANYRLANGIRDLEIAYRDGEVELSGVTEKNYAGHDIVGIREHLNRMLVDACYFEATSYKNLGKYKESIARFSKAIELDPTHLDSRVTRVQVMFFDARFEQFGKECEELDKILNSFSGTDADEVDKAALKDAKKFLKLYQGNMYLPKDERLLPTSRSGYKKYEDKAEAMKFYRQAYDHSTSARPTFALAQAMEQVTPASWGRGETPEKMYEEAMRKLKDRVTHDHDLMYAVMLYYMLAVCACKLTREKENAQIHLAEARRCLRELPEDITYFSPMNKIRLSRAEILEEMNKFEKYFIKK